jgi:hypothetical protein
MVLVGTIIIVISIIVAWKWIDGIDFMKDLHPDYEGEDFP